MAEFKRGASRWKPLGGTEWLQLPDWALQEKLPQRPTMLGHGNGRPEPVPYTYQGTGEDCPPPDDDAREQLEAVIWQAMRRHGVTTRRPVQFVDDILNTLAPRPKARPATWLDDPALRYAACPVSAPASWIRDYDKGEL